MNARWTLRRRLTVGVGVVLLAVGASISAVTVLSVRSLLIDRLDADILSVSTRLPPLETSPGSDPGEGGDGPPEPADGPPNEGDEPAERDDAALLNEFRPAATVIFDDDGAVLQSRAAGFLDDPSPLPDVTEVASPEVLDGLAGTFIDLDDVQGGPLRAYFEVDPNGGWRVVAQSSASVSAVLRQLMLISGLVTLAAAGLGAAAVWWLLRQGFRPVDRMIAAAAAIAGGDRKHRVEVEDDGTELGRLGASLDHMMDELATAEADRQADAVRLRRFVDDASHELRTPVAAIVGYVELYEEGGITDRQGLARAMGRIGEAGRRAARLIEDLLALARLDHELATKREPVELTAMAAELVADTMVATGRTLRSRFDPGGPGAEVAEGRDPQVWVDGDRVWLWQALSNIVGNAVAYAPEEEPIDVVVRRRGDVAELSVVDRGPGVEPGERDRVFERFARPGQARDRAAGGAGLGLAIVKGIAEGHGGSVVLTETPGGGATVTLSLPALADGGGLADHPRASSRNR